ncbi:PepSY-associated TM helix domain-containing protein [Aquabacterium sp.]|uniref:PepSY-associated TM helix domain-containing protein n=1 Tax=Aquabacterium sp. TaxID=1872578 RepID=UPI002B6E74B6|nr:PepSY-associated TM helix domain-containing protein [Aquabacterium sp.]HSW07625.1 PepSY-associated TM helix domain-containing protein [Aquabacterium sp.]
MRPVLVSLHRWFGLAAALFLFIAGATGAVISWDHELDEWLNPQLYQARTAGTPLAPLELAARIERDDPRVRVTFMPLAVEPGHAFVASVSPRVDPATGKLFEPGYNQVALDPATGETQGRREWGKVSLTRENLLPFLYKLHYTMHIPDGWGIEFGMWFMGLIGIAWVLDTLIALWISFPNWRQWRRSFAFRWQDGGHKLTFDLHRSGAMWIYLLVLVLAVTSVAMNLRDQVVRPVVSWFSELSPSPFASRTPTAPERAIEPTIDATRAIELARAEARHRGVDAAPGGLFLSPEFGVWGVGFYDVANSHGDGGLGNPWIYLDARTGAPAGASIPGTGSAGDIFLQSMFPLHSGRIIGLPGRVLMSLMGAMVAMLCVTGVLIWARKRKARERAMRPAPTGRAALGAAQAAR